MKTWLHVLVIVGFICYGLAISSKIFDTFLYDFGIKPIAALVFGNACLLIAIVIRLFWEKK